MPAFLRGSKLQRHVVLHEATESVCATTDVDTPTSRRQEKGGILDSWDHLHSTLADAGKKQVSYDCLLIGRLPHVNHTHTVLSPSHLGPFIKIIVPRYTRYTPNSRNLGISSFMPSAASFGTVH